MTRSDYDETHIDRKKKKRRQSKRRQQVKRQLGILAGVILIMIIVISSCAVRKHRKAIETEQTVKSGQQHIKDVKKDAEETPKEKVERIRNQAEKAGYPEGVIKLLDKNPETAEFVENYGEKNALPPAETIGEGEDVLRSGGIPQLLQWDERWGYAPYGTSIVAVSGCGPTCMSMVVSGLTGDNTITPAVLAAYGTEHGYIDGDNNTYWAFMKEAGANWGISCQELGASEQEVAAALTEGHPIICSVGPGDFTKSGHFIVLTSYDNGSVTVCDPFSRENSEKTWVYAQIQSQIKAMWTYTK